MRLVFHSCLNVFFVTMLALSSTLCANYSTGFCKFVKNDFEDSSYYFSGIKGIDRIYLINLDHQVDRRRQMDTLLINHGFQYERFSAVNGLALDKNQLRRFYIHCLPPHKDRIPISPGQIGCLLSHLSIIQQALDKGYETIWVLEDDSVFNKHPKPILEEFIAHMAREKIEWDTLFTDINSRVVTEDGSIAFYIAFEGALGADFDYASAGSIDRAPSIHLAKQIQHRVGSYSMLLSRRGMLKIFNHIMMHSIHSAYDVEWNFLENTRFFQLLEDVVTTNGVESTTSHN